MTTIYRLDDSSLYLCEDCLDELGPISGKWKETALDECSVCGEVDLQSREEMDAYHHDMSNRQWEEDERMWEDHIAPESYLGKTPGTPEWEETSQLRDSMNEQENYSDKF